MTSIQDIANSAYCFELACLAEAYGTTFECDINDAEMIIVYAQHAHSTSGNLCFNKLEDLHEFVSDAGKTVDVVEFGEFDRQPATCCLNGLYAAVEAVFAEAGLTFPRE